MGRKVLFVDDDRVCRLATENKLKDAGYDVFVAADATEAMALQHDLPLDVIILDVNLAGEDGRMLLKFLKRNDPSLPVILYTHEQHDQDAIVAMMQQGAFRYVVKGPDDALLSAVHAAVVRAR